MIILMLMLLKTVIMTTAVDAGYDVDAVEDYDYDSTDPLAAASDEDDAAGPLLLPLLLLMTIMIMIVASLNRCCCF
jgi:hypothetical protein